MWGIGRDVVWWLSCHCGRPYPTVECLGLSLSSIWIPASWFKAHPWESKMIVQVLGGLPLHRKPESQSSRLLASTWFSIDHCRHLWTETNGKSNSLSFSLSNKQKNQICLCKKYNWDNRSILGEALKDSINWLKASRKDISKGKKIPKHNDYSENLQPTGKHVLCMCVLRILTCTPSSSFSQPAPSALRVDSEAGSQEIN